MAEKLAPEAPVMPTATRTVARAARVRRGFAFRILNRDKGNPSNTFTAGTMTMSNSRDNLAILTASNMKPGDPATAAAEHKYEFSVAFDGSATNAYQGDNSVVPFTWTAA